MRVLLDTNVLLRLAQVASVHHVSAVAAVEQLVDAGHELCIVPQSLYEYWVVATRPVEVNGFGMEVSTVELQMDELVRDYMLLRDERGVYTQWRTLVSVHRVIGKNAHDARLVAAMLRHGLTQLLTFNTADFTRYASVQGFSPTEYLAGTVPI